MSNDARFEFVLIDGGSQQSDSSAVMPRERDDLRDLLESILNRAGVQLPKGAAPTPTPQPTVTPTEVVQPQPAPETKSPDVGAVPVTPPKPSPVPSPTLTPQPQPLPAPREPQTVTTPKVEDVTSRTPQPVARPEPVAVPKPEPRPEPIAVPTPEPVKQEPPPKAEQPQPIDRQPTEPSKVPERFVNYPPKETPTPITPSDLEAMKKDYGKPYDPIKAAEDLARQESADRMRSLAERMNAEREQRLAEAAAKRKADHERAMAASDEAIKARYNAPDAKKIFEELRADAKKAADLKYGPSPIDRTGDIIEAIAVEGKDAAKATAAAGAGARAAVGAAARAAGGAGAAAGSAAGGAAAGGALAGIAASAAVGTLGGMAAAAPFMAFNTVKKAADQLAETLGNMSPEIAMAKARAETAMTFRRLEMAQQFGPDVAKVVEGNTDFKIAASRLAAPFVGPVLEDVASLYKGLGDVAQSMGLIADKNDSILERITRFGLDITGLSQLGSFGDMLSRMAGADEQSQGFGKFLDDLDFITPPGWDAAPSSPTEDWGMILK